MASMFASVAAGMQSPENAATKALRYILQASGAHETARRGLQKLLHAACLAPLPPMARYETFQLGDRGGIPDLAGKGVDGKRNVLIENKFWAGLTDNQPVGYLTQLEPGGLLLFVVPQDRRYSLRIQLDEKLRGAGSETEWREIPSYKLFVRNVDGNRTLAIGTWNSVLGSMLDELEATQHIQARDETIGDIQNLRELCDQIAPEVPYAPFSLAQLVEQEVPRRLKMLVALTTKIIEQACRANSEISNAHTPRQWADSIDYFGQHLVMSGETFWFGLYIDPWEKYGISPLWLCWHLGKPLPPRIDALRQTSRKTFEAFEHFLIPIRLKSEADEDDVIMDAVDQLLSIVRDISQNP